MIQQKFKPNSTKLNIIPVEIDISTLTEERIDNKKESVSREPQVYYNSLELPAPAIKNLTVDYTTFLPTFTLTFIDLYNLLHTNGLPVDNSTITIILPSNNKVLANIFMDFKINEFTFATTKDNEKKITMAGVINVDDILISQYKTYDMSSYAVFEEVARSSGLGFSSNCSGSQDKMKWSNFGWKLWYFLQDTVNKAWVGDSGFVWGFIDPYYNLNYIDLEKSLNQNIDEIVWSSSGTFDGQNEKTTTNNTIAPFISNADNLKSTDLYFIGDLVNNQSTKTSLDRGYLRTIHYYDINGNWKDKSGSYKKYVLDTISTPGSEKSTIYLKGNPGSIEFYNKNKTFHYLGHLDTKNMFADFLWSEKQNQENLIDLQKITMQIILTKPNFNIKRFEKILVNYINNNQTINSDIINSRINGEWLVTGFSFKWNGNNMLQYVNIVKREITIV